jgi:hypothetical protein
MRIFVTRDSGRAVEFDAVVRETHNSSVTVTSHPVEKGSNINDHVRPEPLKLSIEACVSDTPIVEPATQTDGIRGSHTNESLTVQYSQIVAPGVRLPGQQTIAFEALRFDGTLKRVRNVYKDLQEIQADGALCSVRTHGENGIRDYDEMLIVSISAPRSAESGTSVAFSIEMQQVRIVETRKVKPAPKKALKKKGQKPKKEVKAEEKPKQERSFSKAFVKAVAAGVSGG